MATLEERLVAHLSETRYEDLPAEAVAAARRCVVDTLGVLVAGSSGDDVDTLLRWLERQGGPPQATGLLHGPRFPAIHAPLAEGGKNRPPQVDDPHEPPRRPTPP